MLDAVPTASLNVLEEFCENGANVIDPRVV